jgi:hypothetical protein
MGGSKSELNGSLMYQYQGQDKNGYAQELSMN